VVAMSPLGSLPKGRRVAVIKEGMSGAALGLGDGVMEHPVEFQMSVGDGGLVEGKGGGALVVPPAAAARVRSIAWVKEGCRDRVDVCEESAGGRGDLHRRGGGGERRGGEEGEHGLPGVGQVVVNRKAIKEVGRRRGVGGVNDGDGDAGVVRAEGEVEGDDRVTKEWGRGSCGVTENKVEGGGLVAIGTVPSQDAGGVETDKVLTSEP
jgi:hypothetical protein